MVTMWRLCCVVLVVAGCAKPAAYVCASGDDCGDGAACLAAPDGQTYCAAASSACASGWAFADSAGGLAGTCVAGDGPDGVADAVCRVGVPLERTSACTSMVCDAQPACCAASWTRACVQLAERLCDVGCAARVAWATTGTVDVRDFALVSSSLTDTPLPGFGEAAQKYFATAWVDLARDGRPELVVTTGDGNNGGDQQLVLRARAGGWDVVKDLRELGAATYEAFEAAAGDLDHDGRLDLAITGIYPGVIGFRGVASAAVLVEGPVFPRTIDDYQGSSIDIGDYDNDGDDELVAADYRTGVGSVLRWDPSSMTYTIAAGFGPFNSIRRVAFGDVDGDRDLDLAVVASTGVQVLRNTGGQFEPTALWSYGPANFYPADAAWIDVDADGDLDLVVGELQADGAPLRLFENTGADLTDEVVWSSAAPECVRDLAVGDVDGDGDPDLVLAGEQTANRIYLNDGDLTFSIGWTATSVRPTFGVAVTRPAPP